jgi:hypothetical protein
MNDFWNNNALSSYILTEIFDVDEIVRRFGGCPDDEDYKIERIYFYVEFRGAEGHELIYVTEDEYKLHVELGDDNYRTDLNYHDFLNKFWFNEFQYFLRDTILPNEMLDFLDLAHEKVLIAEHTAKAKIIFQDILTGLIHVYKGLNYIAPHISKNKVQEFVIEQYKSSYSDAIKLFIKKYEVIFPSIIKNFKGEWPDIFELENEDISTNKNEISPKDKKQDLHNHIFKNNAFLVWEYLKEKLDVTESSRADVKFTFEEMKKNCLIHDTVNQTSFLNWINEIYGLAIEKTSKFRKTKLRLDRYQEALELYKSHKDS